MSLEETERAFEEMREREEELDRQIAEMEEELPRLVEECERAERELGQTEESRCEITRAVREARRRREEGGRVSYMLHFRSSEFGPVDM